MPMIFIKLLLIFIFSSCHDTPVDTTSSNKPKTNTIFLEGKRYKERENEQEILRRALSHLEYFDSDGQIKFYSGGYNGSIFWFSPRVLMTNEHVISKHNKNDIGYIAFPRIVFYKKDHEQEIKNYIQKRLERENAYIAQGKNILIERIKNLKMKPVKTPREENILQSYLQDLQLLNKYQALTISDKIFIPLDEAIEKLWTPHAKNAPDIALVILKKPLQELLKDAQASLKLNNNFFAENNLYDPAQHGWIYEGTPVYSAGYGRKPEGSIFDKDKALDVSRVQNFQPHTFFRDHKSLALSWDLWLFEKEFYYFEPGTSGPGSSGARLWVYLDNNNIISTKPGILDRKSITIGIHTGAEHIFNKDDSNELWQELIKYSPYLKQKKSNSFPQIEQSDSSSLDYLVSFKKDIKPELAKALMWYAIYNILKTGQIYDAEGVFLWNVVFAKLSDAFKLNRNDYYNFFGSYLEALAPLFLTTDASPSELDENKIKKYISNSSIMNEENKKLFKSMTENNLFADFKNDPEIYLAHVNARVKLSDYLQALNKWVNAKRYNRSTYLDNNTHVKVSNAEKHYAHIQDLEATFGIE